MPSSGASSVAERPFLSRAFSLLGQRGQAKLIRFQAQRLRKLGLISLPLDISSIGRVAIILPERPLDALYQLRTVMALVALFERPEVVVICELRIASYFEHIEGISEIVTYEAAERYVFSREMNMLATQLAQREFDVCLLLERRPDVALLHFMAQLSAMVRVGYDEAVEYPFLNVRIRLSDINRAYVGEQNFALARILGARPPGKIRWSVSKDAIEEMRHILGECGIGRKAQIAAIEIAGFYNSHGEQWCNMLLDSLMAQANYTWFLFCDTVPDEGPFFSWLEGKGLPLLTNLSPSRAAALVHLSSVIVSGPAVLLELASLLNKSSIGVFGRDEAVRYCRRPQTCTAVTYDPRPDSSTVDRICSLVSSSTK